MQQYLIEKKMKFPLNKIVGFTKDLFRGAVDLVYPPLCLICEVRLQDTEDQVCLSCLSGFNLLGKEHEHFSVPGEIFLHKAWALFDFDPAFQTLIHHLKYSKRRKPVLTVLNHYRAEIAAQLANQTYDFIVSIPLHPRKLRERGYNQVDDMSNWLAMLLGAKLGNHLVAREKYTKSQTQLNAAERQKNVAQAFAVKDGVPVLGQRILLVDDVLTTGATANALASVLRGNGADQVDLLTLSTPKHGNA